MGAMDFVHEVVGKTAQAAFKAACETAAYDHGHGGYTGTIAEKSEFIMVAVPAGKNPHEFAEDLIHDDNSKISDKWGPAGCIDLGPVSPKERRYLFFGWASS